MCQADGLYLRNPSSGTWLLAGVRSSCGGYQSKGDPIPPNWQEDALESAGPFRVSVVLLDARGENLGSLGNGFLAPVP